MPDEPRSVDLRAGDARETQDLPLWEVIRTSSEALSFENYTRFVAAAEGTPSRTEPALANVRSERHDPYRALKTATAAFLTTSCGVLDSRRDSAPCLLELIWSYWHEEGMLVLSLDAIGRRAKRRSGDAEPAPLDKLSSEPLLPLDTLLRSYARDRGHRSAPARRAYEYDHEYGLKLTGRASTRARDAGTRSTFPAVLRHLLHRASTFLEEDDDTTRTTDSAALLDALRELHLLLAEGAHNQMGELPWTARAEMLIQQWILSRPEFREFLPERIVVPYPEDWMASVDTIRHLHGWGETSVRHYSELGRLGEQLLLSIRFGRWSDGSDGSAAASWARYWRAELKRYIRAYQAVSGINLVELCAFGD